MPLSRDYQRLLRKEVKAYTVVQKSFKRQKKFLEDNLQLLYEKYPYNIALSYNYLNNALNLYPKKRRDTEYVDTDEPLGGFWRAMGINDMISSLIPIIKKSVESGYKRVFRIYRELLENNGLRYDEDIILEYAEHWGDLNLSNYKGAISHTTKMDVVKVLKEGLDNNRTYDEVKEKIYAIDEKLFGIPRARAIAVTEMHKAYEYGNNKPMKELSDAGIQVQKKWLTCGDDKVRPDHRAAEEEGRVPFDYLFPSVGVQYPPGGVNCRCTILYNID